MVLIALQCAIIITVTWPTIGITDRLHNIPSDRSYKLREGEGKLTQLTLR